MYVDPWTCILTGKCLSQCARSMVGLQNHLCIITMSDVLMYADMHLCIFLSSYGSMFGTLGTLHRDKNLLYLLYPINEEKCRSGSFLTHNFCLINIVTSSSLCSFQKDPTVTMLFLVWHWCFPVICLFEFLSIFARVLCWMFLWLCILIFMWLVIMVRVASAGLGFLQFCNLNSFRTKFILGFAFFMGLSVPQYFNEFASVAGYGPVHTGARWVCGLLD